MLISISVIIYVHKLLQHLLYFLLYMVRLLIFFFFFLLTIDCRIRQLPSSFSRQENQHRPRYHQRPRELHPGWLSSFDHGWGFRVGSSGYPSGKQAKRSPKSRLRKSAWIRREKDIIPRGYRHLDGGHGGEGRAGYQLGEIGRRGFGSGDQGYGIQGGVSNCRRLVTRGWGAGASEADQESGCLNRVGLWKGEAERESGEAVGRCCCNIGKRLHRL